MPVGPRTFGLFFVFSLVALFVVLEQDGGDESLEVHHVLVEVAGVFVLPDAPLQVVLPRLPRGEDVNARAMLYHPERGKKVLRDTHSYPHTHTHTHTLRH